MTAETFTCECCMQNKCYKFIFDGFELCENCYNFVSDLSSELSKE